MKSIKGWAVGLALLVLPMSSFAVNAAYGKVFDKWVAGVYTDSSTLGPFYIERVGGDAYYFQGSSMVVFGIDSIEIISPIQVKTVLTNPSGGVVVWDRFGSEMDVHTPNGQIIPTNKIRDLTSSEKKMIHKSVGKSSASRAVVSASFDCTNASTKTEKMICGNASIAKLDVELAQRYKSLMKLSSGRDEVFNRQEQREWLAERNKCAGAKCLIDSYGSRISELDTIIRHMNKPAEFR